MNTKLNNIEWINSKRPWFRRTRAQCHEVTFVVWHVSAFKQLHVSNHVGFNVHKSHQKMEQTWTCCWQLLIHTCVFLSQYLVRAAPASPSGAPSWTPAAARSQSRPRRRNLWTRSPAGTPPGLPWTASSGALWTPHTHTWIREVERPRAGRQLVPAVRRLTLVQFEDGVWHGGQHSFTLQDVDVPDPEGEGEGSLDTNRTAGQKVVSLFSCRRTD